MRILVTALVLVLVSAAVVAKKKTYYEILGVEKTASTRQIKKAYRKLAVKYHPDKNREKDADEKWLEITNAYEVLSDKEKRQRYDQFGEDGLKDSFGGRGGQNFNGNGFSFHFDDMFGGGSPFDHFQGGPFGGFGDEDDFGGHSTFSFSHSNGHDDEFDSFSDHHHYHQQQQHDHHDNFFGNSMFSHDDGGFDPFDGFGDQFGFDGFGDMFGAGGGGGGGGQNCRTITKRMGNTITTHQICD